MRWVGFRNRSMTTRTGVMSFLRGYWVCQHCSRGDAPDDATLGIPSGQFSYGVEESVAMLGQALPFATAASLYHYLLGVEVSSKSVELLTESVGASYQPPVLGPYEAGPRADTLFIMGDAGMLLTREASWKERKVFAAWQRVDGEDYPVRYAVGAGAWDDQETLVFNLARREGSRMAGEIVCIADGAPAIWKLLTRQWPEAFQLLDWFHLMEHLDTVVALHPDGKAWRERQQTALLNQGYRPLAKELRLLAKAGATKELQEVARACLHYVWANRMRMDYPEAKRKGYPIGSGRIESAVKQVLQHRCKQAGMRWKATHLDNILAAKCAYLSGDWDLACQQRRRAA